MKAKFILSSPEHYFRTRLIGINTSSYDEVIEIDPAKQRQVMQGFGGAFTEAAAHVYATLSKKDKDKNIYLYKIIGIAKHTETKEMVVVYQSLYGDFGMYVRPYEMFIGKVDKEKYPDIKQVYRFEKVNEEV